MWILVVWGRKKIPTALGYAADFCSICRKIRPFAVEQIDTANHVYFIRVGPRTFVENRQTCCHCRTVSTCNLGTFTCLVPSRDLTLEELARKTYPKIHEAYSQRLTHQDRLVPGSEAFNPAARKAALLEVFNFAAPHFSHGSGVEGRRILAVGLRPLNPTAEEIRECLQQFRRAGSPMGVRLRTADVHRSISPKRQLAHGEYDY